MKRAPKVPTLAGLKVRRSQATEAMRAAAFLLILKQNRVTPPVTEFRFHPTRKWRFDFAWTHVRLALESEGGLFVNGGHNRGAKMLDAFDKFNAAALLGWRVLRVPSNVLCTMGTVDLVKQGLKP